MECKLSILICTIHARHESFIALQAALNKQTTNEVEIISNLDGGEKTIGQKRNELLAIARGKYICFVDDDDTVSDNYIDQLLQGITTGADCCSLRGVITWDGQNEEFFEHSIKYQNYSTTTNLIKYERFPNHLNAIKSTIAKQFKFPEINFSEDTEWATQIHNSGLIQSEHYIDTVLYHYQFKTKK